MGIGVDVNRMPFPTSANHRTVAAVYQISIDEGHLRLEPLNQRIAHRSSRGYLGWICRCTIHVQSSIQVAQINRIRRIAIKASC